MYDGVKEINDEGLLKSLMRYGQHSLSSNKRKEMHPKKTGHKTHKKPLVLGYFDDKPQASTFGFRLRAQLCSHSSSSFKKNTFTRVQNHLIFYKR